MIYRVYSNDKDFVLGEDKKTFVEGIQAVEQAIYSRLKLLYGEWWENIEDGYPFFQQIAGFAGTAKNKDAMDLVTIDRILGTQGVNSIINFSSTFNGEREYTITARVNTIYGELEVIN